MSGVRSRSAEPLRGTQTAHAMGVWGLVLALIALVMFMAGLAAAALYLETGQPRDVVTGEADSGWPPPHIEVPARHLAVLALLAIVATGLALSAAVRRVAVGASQRASQLVALGLATAVTAVILLVVDLQRVSFGWDEHAYASVYWALTGAASLFVGVVALMAASILVQLLTGVVDAHRHLEVLNTAIFGWFTVLASGILLGLVHVLPVVSGSS